MKLVQLQEKKSAPLEYQWSKKSEQEWRGQFTLGNVNYWIRCQEIDEGIFELSFMSNVGSDSNDSSIDGIETRIYETVKNAFVEFCYRSAPKYIVVNPVYNAPNGATLHKLHKEFTKSFMKEVKRFGYRKTNDLKGSKKFRTSLDTVIMKLK